MKFSLFFFSSEINRGKESQAYQLLWKAARFADQNGFSAIWTPERHFASFGASFASPSLTSAALSQITENIEIRAGSVVLPLHHPFRVAEEWAMLDHFSGGRIGICFASGWHAQDFVFAPSNYPDKHKVMIDSLQVIKKLWGGESVEAISGEGTKVAIRTYPRPFQKQIPLWFAASGHPKTFALAGEHNVGILTHLLSQNIEELKPKIDLYRNTLSQFQDARPNVVLMMHTFLAKDNETARAMAFHPMKEYLRTALALELSQSQNQGLTEHPDDLEVILDYATEGYLQEKGLFGSPEGCLKKISHLAEQGIDEIACFIDFGLSDQKILEHLPYIAQLQKLAQQVGVL